MAKFKDGNGDEWEIRITAGHLRPLREDFGIDLRDTLKPGESTLVNILGDPEQFMRVVYSLCEPQVEKRGLTPEQFAYRFDGDTLEAAAVALFGAINDFFRVRTGEKAAATFRTGLTKTSDAVNAVWDKAAESLTSSNGALNSAEPSASTPGPSPSAS